MTKGAEQRRYPTTTATVSLTVLILAFEMDRMHAVCDRGQLLLPAPPPLVALFPREDEKVRPPPPEVSAASELTVRRFLDPALFPALARWPRSWWRLRMRWAADDADGPDPDADAAVAAILWLLAAPDPDDGLSSTPLQVEVNRGAHFPLVGI